MNLPNVLLILFITYLIVVIFIFFYQRKLLYHPSENNYLDETNLNHKIEKIYIQSDTELISWYYNNNKSYKTILFFHGNAGRLDNRVYKLNELAKLNQHFLRSSSQQHSQQHKFLLYFFCINLKLRKYQLFHLIEKQKYKDNLF